MRGVHPTLVLGLCLATTVSVVAARLKPEAETGWTKYVTATERRMAGELAGHDRFLALDFTSSSAADHRALLAGEVVVHSVDSLDTSGGAIEIFLDNIGRFTRGEDLREVVDPDEGY